MRTFSATKPPTRHARASILVHGLTGSGKTTRALQGGKPLVICLEPKAEAHVLRLNPSATCWVPESCQDIERIFEWLGKPELQEQGFTRIVLDSYTELTEQLPDWILKKQAADAVLELGRRIDLAEYRPVQQWGLAMIRAIQLSGLPSIIIARSDAKESGRITRIVPAGLGSSSRNLNAQLVPTVEARWDEELQGYIWDSRPDEYSQRCGLLWVPTVWSGTADEFLAQVESGSAELAPEPPPPPKRETAQEAFQAQQALVMATKPQVSEEAETLVDQIADGPDSPTFLSQEEWGTLEDYLRFNKIDRDAFLRFAIAERHVVPAESGRTTLGRMLKASFDRIEPAFKDPKRLHNMVTHIACKYSNPVAA